MHPAETYNQIKNRAFSIYNRDGIDAARTFLLKEKGSLPYPAWCGLCGEIEFYNRYKNKYVLDPILDYGIKCDFSGNIDGVQNCRIDVTTNIDFKRLQQYEPIMSKDNRKYKIAVVDYKTGEIADIIDLNFPYDESGSGRRFDIALFMPSDTDKDGCDKYNYYQKILSIGSSNPYDDVQVVNDCLTDWYLPDIATYISNIPDEYDEDMYKNEIKEYLEDAAKLISKTTGRNIVACAQTFNRIYDQNDDEGDNYTKFYWKHPVISDFIDDELDCDLSEVW